MTTLQEEIETRLAQGEPDVEVLLADRQRTASANPRPAPDEAAEVRGLGQWALGARR